MHQNAAFLKKADCKSLFGDPPGLYRPTPESSGSHDAEPGSDGPSRQQYRRRKDQGRGGLDLIWALVLSIAGVAFVLYSGVLVDVVLDDTPESGELPSTIAALALALAFVIAIAFFARLPKATSVNMLVLAALANVLIHLISDGGDSDFFGVPSGFLESTLISSIPFGVAWLFITRKYGLSLREMGVIWPERPSAFLIAISAWGLAYVGVVIWTAIVTSFDTLEPPDNTTPSLELVGGSVVFAVLLVGILVPIFEELFFRGFLLGRLRERMGPWLAIFVSSAIFAVFHISPGLYVPTFILGVAFGWVYLKTRSVWPSILVHSMHNTLAVIVVSLGIE